MMGIGRAIAAVLFLAAPAVANGVTETHNFRVGSQRCGKLTVVTRDNGATLEWRIKGCDILKACELDLVERPSGSQEWKLANCPTLVQALATPTPMPTSSPSPSPSPTPPANPNPDLCYSGWLSPISDDLVVGYFYFSPGSERVYCFETTPGDFFQINTSAEDVGDYCADLSLTLVAPSGAMYSERSPLPMVSALYEPGVWLARYYLHSGCGGFTYYFRWR